MTDISEFEKNYKNCEILTVRIFCNDKIRNNRGFIFQPGIDDAETECGLDNFSHNFTVDNTLDNGVDIEKLFLKIEDILRKSSNT